MSVRFSEVLARYPAFRLATEADNEAILEFFGRVAMDLSSLVLRYDRAPDFFALLRQQSESAIVIVAPTSAGGIGGVGTICLRRAWINGEVVQTGYLSDLRIGSELDRRVRLQWRRFYAELLERAHEIDELRGCRHFYSAVLDQNRAAVQALTQADSVIYYRELARYRSVHLFSRIPLRSRRIEGVRVSRARQSDAESLRAYLHAQNRERLFGHHFMPAGVPSDGAGDELDRRFSTWDGFRLQDFLIAKDSRGHILGCVAPWASRSARKMMADRVPVALRLLGQAMPLLGKAAIGPGRPLELLYLSHLEIAHELPEVRRQEVFRALVEAVFELPEARASHMVSFIDWNGSSLKPALGRDFLMHEVPATFFQVVHRSREIDWTGLRVRPGVAPAFEISIS